MRKYLTIFSVSVLLLISLFAVATFYINHQAVLKHEAMFQEQQKLQVFLVKQAMTDRIGLLFGELEILRTHFLPEFLTKKQDIVSLAELFQSEQAIYSEKLAYILVDLSMRPVLTIGHDTKPGKEAKRLGQKWIFEHWEELSVSEQDKVIPPLYITRDSQMMGILLPIQAGSGFQGVLAVIVNLQPMIIRYIEPMRSGEYGAGYLLDEQGTIVYDHETEIIGRSVFDGMHDDYPDLHRLDNRLIHDPSGTDEYSFTVKRGGQLSRKLIAWNSVDIGKQKLVICLSAPDIEIDNTLFDLRIQRVLFGAFLAVAIVILSAIFFRIRQSMLEQSNKLLKVRVKQRTAELMESKELYSKLIATIPDVVLRTDLDGKILFINEIALKFSGYDLEELLGKNILSFIAPEDQERVVKNTIRMFDQKLGPKEYQLVMKDGRKIPFEVNGDILRDKDGIPFGIATVCRDISDRKRLEMESKKLASRLHNVEKMEALGTLAGGIAHDFNNLLMGIQGRASLISTDFELSHSHLEHTNAIEDYVRSATDLTKQLLGLARGGKYEVKLTDANELVQNSANMFGRTKKEIRIHTNFQDPPPVVSVDRSQIEQVLLNLYINAWQAMPGGGDLYLGTQITALDDAYCKPYKVKPGHYAKVSVTDTGIGMDADTKLRIFDPFFTTKEKGRGTGLGLASAYGIIKNHDGIIVVYSEVGHGTTFNIYLPLSDKEACREVPAEKSLCKGTETVLLIDDEKMILEVGQAMLERMGYHVVVAAGGEQAVSMVKKKGNEIDIAILDLIMPGMDGGEVFDRIKEIRPQMPVVLSSGYAINGQADKIIQRGCNGFIQKPFNISELSQKIRQILGKAIS